MNILPSGVSDVLACCFFGQAETAACGLTVGKSACPAFMFALSVLSGKKVNSFEHKLLICRLYLFANI
jgi:hypothetical protein